MISTHPWAVRMETHTLQDEINCINAPPNAETSQGKPLVASALHVHAGTCSSPTEPVLVISLLSRHALRRDSTLTRRTHRVKGFRDVIVRHSACFHPQHSQARHLAATDYISGECKKHLWDLRLWVAGGRGTESKRGVPNFSCQLTRMLVTTRVRLIPVELPFSRRICESFFTWTPIRGCQIAVFCSVRDKWRETTNYEDDKTKTTLPVQTIITFLKISKETDSDIWRIFQRTKWVNQNSGRNLTGRWPLV